MRGRLFVILLTLLVGGVPLQAGVALASPDDDETASAKRYYRRGMAHYNLDEFDEAIQQFEAGYRVKPDPVFLYNIAQSFRRSDRPRQALTFYEKYLNAAPTAKNRDEVVERIEELRQSVGKSTVPERRPPRLPLPPPVTTAARPVEPNPSRAIATPRSSSPAVKSVPSPAEAAARAAADGTLSATERTDRAALEGRTSSDRPFYRRWWFWTGLGAIVAVGAGAAITAAVLSSSSSETALQDLYCHLGEQCGL